MLNFPIIFASRSFFVETFLKIFREETKYFDLKKEQKRDEVFGEEQFRQKFGI